MLFKNSENVEMNVSNLTMKDGRIFFSVRGKGCGQRLSPPPAGAWIETS